MEVGTHQDLKKPSEFFSSLTATGLVVGTSYENGGRFWNPIAEIMSKVRPRTQPRRTHNSPSTRGWRSWNAGICRSNDGITVRTTMPGRDHGLQKKADVRWGSH